MRSAVRLLVLSVLLTACGSDSGGETDADTPEPLADGGDGALRADGGTDAGTLRDANLNNGGRDASPYVPEAVCGDGTRANPEECDDGNQNEADGCDATCHRELGFNCPITAGACAPVCGDRMLVLGEECDDGASVPGDGCGASCMVEQGWSCLASGAACVAAACGDGFIAGAETCDDGNNVPGDGCSTTCAIEPGWLCAVANMSCTAERCGDSVRAGTEACDDGNVKSGDGCTAACDSIEPNYACFDGAGACVRTSVCGDGLLTSDEQCDDRNTSAGDGCSAVCTSELGWLCTNVGQACTAAKCGDAVIAGSEQCEDGNTLKLDGCDACQIESGWACTFAAGTSTCHRAVCGDHAVEGNETCDDGNDVVGDGCGPNCAVEPTCAVGQACVSSCGDGIRLPSDTAEECDDGNLRDDDGCSKNCKIESGFSCTDVRSDLPASFPLTVVYRDFIRAPTNGSVKHPDFETFSGSDASTGMVGPALVGGKPAYTGACQQGKPLASTCSGGTAQTTTEVNFNQWYANAEITDVMKKIITTVDMGRQGTTSAYKNPTFGAQLFPLDNLGWVATTPLPLELASSNHNFGFTTEIHHWFEFNGGEVLTFSGDDDVWVFIAGKLALDIGGLHSKVDRTISISSDGTVSCFKSATATGTSCGTTALGLTPGSVYEMALFHAERHTNQSNFDLTLNGFVAARSVCVSKCGDGVVTRGEMCDDGSACLAGVNAGKSCVSNSDCPSSTCASKNDGTYGHCNGTCSDYGPHCGDGTVQTGELCDKGVSLNRGGYNGCTQECQPGPRCGDSTVDGFYGEECDDGVGNDGHYGGCATTCKKAPRCGDGILNEANGESCDDGNLNNYDGCSSTCQFDGGI